MPAFLDTLDDFSGGVVTAAPGSRTNWAPRGRNSYLLAVTAQEAPAPAKRRGVTTVNTTQVSSATILHQHAYRYLSGGSFTFYHLIVLSDGKLGYIASDPGGSGAYTALTTGLANAAPCFADANNLVFLVNGTDAKKVRNTTVETFGITRPASAPSLASGAAGTPSGTYEARITYYNSNTGHESSAGPTSAPVTVTAQKIAFTSIPTSGDGQVTDRKLYLRNTATMNNFYLATTLAGNVATTFTYDAADTTLLTKGPNTSENDPPPAGAKYVAHHRSRMFAADDTTLYYSKVNRPEAFDTANAYEDVNPQDGQVITALYSADDVLLILKSRSLYGLYGVDPETWQIRLISADIGCTSFRSLVAADTTLYWWSHVGPIQWQAGTRPLNIGLPLIAPSITNTALAYGQLGNVVGAYDPLRQLVLFGVAAFGKTRNTLLLPWSTQYTCWVSDGWDPLGSQASLATIEDATGRAWIYVGTNAGQLFRLWDVDTDGVPSGTTTGTFVAGSASITTITASGFYTTGSALVERMVSIIAADGTLVGRRYLTTNSATVLTLDAAVSVTSGATYSFVVGGPNFEYDTRVVDSQAGFRMKRFEFLYAQVEAASGTVGVHVYGNFKTGSPRALAFSQVSATQETVSARLRVAKVGSTWQARVFQRDPETPLTLFALGMRGVTLSDHINT